MFTLLLIIFEPMSTLRLYRSRLQSKLEGKLSKDFHLGERDLEQMIHEKGGNEKVRIFDKYGMVYQDWLQDMGATVVTQVSSTDDPNVPPSCLIMGKVKFPKLLNLQDNISQQNKAIARIATLAQQLQFYPVIPDRFYNFRAGDEELLERYYFMVGDYCYIYPYTSYIRPMLVLSNPMDGFVINNTFINSGDLIYANNYRSAETYMVSEATITHDGVIYNSGDTFVAVRASFSGNGKVKLVNQKRKITIDDPYPMDNDMANNIFGRVLKEDFIIESQLPQDLKNDAEDRVSV